MEEQALFKLSYGLYVTGVKTQEGFGGCIVDAVMQVTSKAPFLMMLGSMNHTYTNSVLKQTGELTLSVLPKDVDPFVIANFGFQSARNVPNKWGNVPHTMAHGLPVLTQTSAWLKMKVLDARELSTHTVFTCEVEDAVLGSGEPLLYGDYQAEMKPAVMEAFKQFKAMANK